MVCTRCGNQTNGRVCTFCGNVMVSKAKKPTALIAVSIIAAVIIVLCAVLFFVLPSDEQDVGVAAKNYVTAAYYADRLVNNTNVYSSYKDFKDDLNTAIASCGAIEGGLFDFLTRGDNRYTGGVKETINDFLADMKKDAKTAKAALEALDMSVNSETDADDLLSAVADAKGALKYADETKVVIGNKEVSFSGIKTLGGINIALFGADIIIDEGTLYLGSDGVVLFGTDELGADIAVIDSESADGVVMETGDISTQLQNGSNVVITYTDFDKEPEINIFSAENKPQFADMISTQIGGFSPNDLQTNMGDESTGDNTALHEGGENLNEAFLIGKWQYYPAVINPWKTLSEDEIKKVQAELEDKKTPGSSLTYADKVHERFMIFRPDGTGIDYWVVEEVGINQVMGFWWHIDSSKGEVVLSFKHSPIDGYET